MVSRPDLQPSELICELELARKDPQLIRHIGHIGLFRCAGCVLRSIDTGVDSLKLAIARDESAAQCLPMLHNMLIQCVMAIASSGGPEAHNKVIRLLTINEVSTAFEAILEAIEAGHQEPVYAVVSLHELLGALISLRMRFAIGAASDENVSSHKCLLIDMAQMCLIGVMSIREHIVEPRSKK